MAAGEPATLVAGLHIGEVEMVEKLEAASRPGCPRGASSRPPADPPGPAPRSASAVVRSRSDEPGTPCGSYSRSASWTRTMGPSPARTRIAKRPLAAVRAVEVCDDRLRGTPQVPLQLHHEPATPALLKPSTSTTSSESVQQTRRTSSSSASLRRRPGSPQTGESRQEEDRSRAAAASIAEKSWSSGNHRWCTELLRAGG